MPLISAWDPRATATGSIDPLGALRPFTAIATEMLPGVTTITTRVRYLSWLCAGLLLLDQTAMAPPGGTEGRKRRQRLLAWERLVALATGAHAVALGLSEGDPAWRQLRGVSYVRQALERGVRSAAFPMLRNQVGTGGVGTYWVTLTAGGLVEDASAALTKRGRDLADAFLRDRSTPDQAQLRKVLDGRAIALTDEALRAWGATVHLGAARKAEKRLLADALLEHRAHRHMAAVIGNAQVFRSDESAFRALARELRRQTDVLSKRLAAVLDVAICFEALHRDLLYIFDQVLAAAPRGLVPCRSLRLATGNVLLAKRGERLKEMLARHAATLPSSVQQAVAEFAAAVEPAVRAAKDAQIVEHLVRYHERVQGGKLDAARQPKAPWVQIDAGRLRVAPRYALATLPQPPTAIALTHPYRIEQFTGLLVEVGELQAAP